MPDGNVRLERCGRNLDRELAALEAWYVALGSALVSLGAVPPPHIRDAEGISRLFSCVRQAARGRDQATVHAALVLLWTSQHLENLWRLEAHLGEPANVSGLPPVGGWPLRLGGIRQSLGRGPRT